MTSKSTVRYGMRDRERLAGRLVLGLAGSLAAAVAGCSSFSSMNPLAKTDDFDKTFITAAQTWDLNKDGSVTCDEWKEYVTTSVREADTNGDGALDAPEYQNLIKSDRLFEIANIAYYDTNGDGRVSADEILAKPNRAFQLLDKNNDCQIARNESVQVYAPVSQPKADGQGSEQKGPGGR